MVFRLSNIKPFLVVLLTNMILELLERNIIPKIIHVDQTGFVKNWLGSPNTCPLLNIIHSAQKQAVSRVYECF